MFGTITGGYNPLHHYNYIQNLGQPSVAGTGKIVPKTDMQQGFGTGVELSLSGMPEESVRLIGTDHENAGRFSAEKEDIPLPWETEKENIKLPGQEEEDKTLQGEECETCKNRKYQDGSDENVSFKSAQHISPESAAARVRAHEGEHVANAYSKAMKDGGKVLRASVSIHTDICDECGKVYVSGGTTSTTIQYPGEEVKEPENLENTQETRE